MLLFFCLRAAKQNPFVVAIRTSFCVAVLRATEPRANLTTTRCQNPRHNTQNPHKQPRPPPAADDLEVEIVAALEAQLQQESRDISAGNVDGSWAHVVQQPAASGADAAPPLTTTTMTAADAKEQQHQQKKRWKNAWGWKPHAGGKTSSSIEEEPDSPRQSSSKLSSPANSPKHRVQLQQQQQPTANMYGSSSATTSPLRRQKSPSPSARSADHAAVRQQQRSSAGARLGRMLDTAAATAAGDDGGDGVDAGKALMLPNGRPASVHVVQQLGGHNGGAF